MSNNPEKYEVLIKQHLRSVLDISEKINRLSVKRYLTSTFCHLMDKNGFVPTYEKTSSGNELSSALQKDVRYILSVMIKIFSFSKSFNYITSDHMVQNPPCWRASSLLSRTGTLKHRDLNQSSLTSLCFNAPVQE